LEEGLNGALIDTLDEITERIEALKKSGVDYLLLTNAGNGHDDLQVISKEFL